MVFSCILTCIKSFSQLLDVSQDPCNSIDPNLFQTSLLHFIHTGLDYQGDAMLLPPEGKREIQQTMIVLFLTRVGSDGFQSVHSTRKDSGSSSYQ